MVLNEATLVLNKSWTPIGFSSVKYALKLLVSERAQAISPEDYSAYDFDSWAELSVLKGEPCVHTVNLEIKVPEVIRLLDYNKIPERHVKLSRRNLFRRDKNTCQYCKRKLKTEDITVDHILPRSQGGITSWTNCVVACLKCNIKKGSKTPQQANMQLIREPREPRWIAGFKIPLIKRKVSWDNFISEAYWEAELTE